MPCLRYSRGRLCRPASLEQLRQLLKRDWQPHLLEAREEYARHDARAATGGAGGGGASLPPTKSLEELDHACGRIQALYVACGLNVLHSSPVQARLLFTDPTSNLYASAERAQGAMPEVRCALAMVACDGFGCGHLCMTSVHPGAMPRRNNWNMHVKPHAACALRQSSLHLTVLSPLHVHGH